MHVRVGRMFGYFGSDLEDNLLLPVIEGSATFDAHKVHCSNISKATEIVALSSSANPDDRAPSIALLSAL